MTDIKTIPIDELISDRDDSLQDIYDCRVALVIGVTRYSGESVADRLATNQNIVRVINAELSRREDSRKLEAMP